MLKISASFAVLPATVYTLTLQIEMGLITSGTGFMQRFMSPVQVYPIAI